MHRNKMLFVVGLLLSTAFALPQSSPPLWDDFSMDEVVNAPDNPNIWVFNLNDTASDIIPGNNTALEKRFIPPGRTGQDCDTSINDANFYVSETLQKRLQNHKGKVTVPKGKCHLVARINNIDPRETACYTLCAKGKARTVHFHRVGAIAADVDVGCHSSISLYVQGRDTFPNYNVYVHGCN